MKGRPNKTVIVAGEVRTVADMAAQAGVSRSVMYARLRRQVPDAAVLGPLSDRNVPRKHPYQGQMLNKYELAALAGCTPKRMKSRLACMSAEAAVALGPASNNRPKKPRKEAKPRGATYLHNGQELTVRQLAELVGCSADTMRLRLASGMSADAAVAMGKADKNRKRASGPKPHADKVNTGPRKLLEHAPRMMKALTVTQPKGLHKLDPSAPVICNVQPVVIPHGIDHRHTFTGTPGRWVDSSQCRPWAAAVRG